MEAESTYIGGDDITPEGENPSKEDRWVSPEIAAAESGQQVDFSKHVMADDEDASGIDEE